MITIFTSELSAQSCSLPWQYSPGPPCAWNDKVHIKNKKQKASRPISSLDNIVIVIVLVIVIMIMIVIVFVITCKIVHPARLQQ